MHDQQGDYIPGRGPLTALMELHFSATLLYKMSLTLISVAAGVIQRISLKYAKNHV